MIPYGNRTAGNAPASRSWRCETTPFVILFCCDPPLKKTTGILSFRPKDRPGNNHPPAQYLRTPCNYAGKSPEEHPLFDRTEGQGVAIEGDHGRSIKTERGRKGPALRDNGHGLPPCTKNVTTPVRTLISAFPAPPEHVPLYRRRSGRVNCRRQGSVPSGTRSIACIPVCTPDNNSQVLLR